MIFKHPQPDVLVVFKSPKDDWDSAMRMGREVDTYINCDLLA